MSFELCLLGSVELYTGAHAAVLGSAKRRTMLAALALKANQPVSLDRLAEAVWAGSPPRSAVANLRTHAAALRRILGDRLVAIPGGYQLRVEAGEVDAHEFVRLADNGRAALGAGDARAAVLRLTAALGLWRGDAAGEGLPRGTYLNVHFASLDEQRLNAFEDLVEARLALAEHGGVLRALRRHLARQPLRERAWGQLMLALYRAGNPAAALETYHDARTALRHRLGVEPGPELIALQRAVLDRDPALSPPAARVSALATTGPEATSDIRHSVRQLRPDAPDLISRAEKLAAELAAFAAAMRGAKSPAA